MPRDNSSWMDVASRAREGERERYYAALLAPEPQRSALIALAAFAAELRRIPSVVTEPMMGELRLQWWRDTLEQLEAGEAVGHPAAEALGAAMRTYELPRAMLVAMTEARAFDLYADAMPDEASFDGYVAKTEAIPFELALRVLGVVPQTAARLSGEAGKIFGLARALAELPLFAARGRQILPVSRFIAAGLPPNQVGSAADAGTLRRLITEGCVEIVRRSAAVSPQMALLSRSQRVGILPLAVVPLYLRALQKKFPDRLDRAIEISPFAIISQIALAHVFGRWR